MTQQQAQDREAFWWESFIFDAPPPRPQGATEASTTTADVLVVGSGPAGFSAAITAHDGGSHVIILEAGDEGGGTCYKAGGGIWIPDNHHGRANGYVDDREATMHYMASLSYPDRFDPEAPRLGLSEVEYALLETRYERAGEAILALERAGALKCRPYRGNLNATKEMINYQYPYGGLGLGKHLASETADGRQGFGAEIVHQLGQAARSRGIELLVKHRVVDVVTDGEGAVVGLEVETPQGRKQFDAKQGVVFGSGGFTHNPDLVKEHFKGRLFGGGAVSTNVGDFVEIGKKLGAKMANMENGWLAEAPLLQTLENRELNFLSFVMPGDSIILVNSEGKRVVNEKLLYQERAEVHYERDAEGNQPNEFLFAVYDDFVANDDRPNLMRYPDMGAHNEYVVTGRNPRELAEAVNKQLASIAEHVDGLQLDEGFADNLLVTLERFNRFAKLGVDEDFGRGGVSQYIEHDWMCGAERPGNTELHTMYPFDLEGPLHAIIMVAVTLDTNGGPVTNAQAQVLGEDRRPIPGLYAAGGSAASPSAGAYWSGGVPIGNSLTFGYIAGQELARQPRREVAEHARQEVV